MYFSTQTLLSLAALVTSLAQVDAEKKHPPEATTIFQFEENETWIESIRSRSDGRLIFTELYHPHVWGIDALDHKPDAELIVSIPGLTGLLGIEEISKDEYIVLGARFTDGSAGFVEGSGEAWVFKLNGSGKEEEPRMVAKLGDAGLPNGIDLVPGSKGNAVVFADSTKGLIWRIDIPSGQVDKVLDTAELKATIDSPDVLPLGVNDVLFGDCEFGDEGFLYWTNTNTRHIWRAHARPDGTFSPGTKPELVADISYVDALDGFTRSSNGTFFVTTNVDNKLVSVDYDGHHAYTRIVLGGDTDKTIAGDTSVTFGKAQGSRSTLYVGTSGAHERPLPGGYTEGAKIVAVHLPQW